jgi:DNA-binding NtrC family response regulator
MTSVLPPINSHLPSGNSNDTIRILVVDDEPAILFAYRKLIEKDGMIVDTSANIEDALQNVRARTYHAVIADMRLAGTDNMDGLEILRFIQKERPETKTILATGYGDREIEKLARGLGVSYYFKKPVQAAEILGALREFHFCTTHPPVAEPV